jgi:hypothetical protein
MKPCLSSPLPLALVALVAGCSKPSPQEQQKAEEQLAAAIASAMASATTEPPAAPKAITFETKTQEKLGVTISIPQGAKLLSDDPLGTSYSLALPPLDSIDISLTSAIGVTNLKTAVEDASVSSQPIAEKKEIDKTAFQIIKAPVAGIVFVYFYKKVKRGWVKAMCDGPEGYKDQLVFACSSLASK